LTEELVEREVAREQDFVDRVYVQLKDSASAARALAREGHDRGRLGHEGGLVERDAMVFQAAKRIALSCSAWMVATIECMERSRARDSCAMSAPSPTIGSSTP
jgi:hypothetical protein